MPAKYAVGQQVKINNTASMRNGETATVVRSWENETPFKKYWVYHVKFASGGETDVAEEQLLAGAKK